MIQIKDKYFDNPSAEGFKKFEKKELKKSKEITVEKFLYSILRNADSLEILIQNHHQSDVFELIEKETEWKDNLDIEYKPVDNDSKIKKAVKVAGGQIDGVLNFRLAWNDKDGADNSDLDAWAKEPNGGKIGYSTPYRKDGEKKRSPYSGQLDVDNTKPNHKLAVENITWDDFNAMPDGNYKLWVHQYSERHSQGFKAEIEYLGDVYTYTYDNRLPQGQTVDIATITFKDRQFSINHLLSPTNGIDVSSVIHNLNTMNWYEVHGVVPSPNHWNEQSIGIKHYLFFIKNAINANTLAGIGINSSKRDSLIIRINKSEIYEVKF